VAVSKIEHVGIMVQALDVSIPFYEHVVGLKHTETLHHTNGVIRLAFLSFPESKDTEVELIEGFTEELAKAGRVHHIAFTADDIEQEFIRIRALNIAGLDEQITALPNGSRYFFFDGPDGEAIEFFQSTRGGTN
jgi:lactoylglutathione lyase